MSKVKTTDFSIIIGEKSGGQAYSNGDLTLVSGTAPVNGDYLITCSARSSDSGLNRCFYNNDGGLSGTGFGPYLNTSWTTAQTTVTLTAGQKIYAKVTASSYKYVYNNYSKIELKLIKAEDMIQIPLYMNQIKEIGELGIGTLYGNHQDGEYKGGIIISKETTATTGTITLGNAVGYLKVNFNGEIVKIPYYDN